MGGLIGAWMGWMVGLIASSGSDWGENENWIIAVMALAGSAIVVASILRFLRGRICSSCRTRALDRDSICGGCEGTLGAKISARELRIVRAAEVERQVTEKGWEECDACQPEEPCDDHRPMEEIGPDWFVEES